jgi:hypothetical protein
MLSDSTMLCDVISAMAEFMDDAIRFHDLWLEALWQAQYRAASDMHGVPFPYCLSTPFYCTLNSTAPLQANFVAWTNTGNVRHVAVAANTQPEWDACKPLPGGAHGWEQ